MKSVYGNQGAMFVLIKIKMMFSKQNQNLFVIIFLILKYKKEAKHVGKDKFNHKGVNRAKYAR